jgi:hypothetical protein
MKILYIFPYIHEINGITHVSDYQASLLLDGLKLLFGENVVDYPLCESQYEITENKLNLNPLSREQFLSRDVVAGKGFTSLFLIDEKNRNKNNFSLNELEQMIEDKFFDIIFFAQTDNNSKLWGFESLFFKSINSKNKVCIIDGSDLHYATREVIHYEYVKELDKVGGYYFKRELVSNPTNVIRPISFAFPNKKISKAKELKTQIFALETFNRNYKFTSEKDYYKEYRKSFFGKTMKKGGWDCMRHYEIIFNRCIPFFYDLDSMPHNTMINFPRDLIKSGMKTLQSEKIIDTKSYYEIEESIFNYALANLTTEALAKYVLNTVIN